MDLHSHYPKHWHNILTALQAHPPMTLRVNRRRGNAESYLAALAEAGIAAKALDDYAVQLAEPLAAQLPGFSDGLVSVHDFGAQAAYLVNPQDGERILDACAAPGGQNRPPLSWPIASLPRSTLMPSAWHVCKAISTDWAFRRFTGLRRRTRF